MPAGVLGRLCSLPAERHPSASPGYLRERARLRVLEPDRAAAYLPPRIAIRRRRMIPGLRQIHWNQGSTRRLASIRGLALPARRRPAVFVPWEPPPKPAGGRRALRGAAPRRAAPPPPGAAPGPRGRGRGGGG